jgi:hypothetical protein
VLAAQAMGADFGYIGSAFIATQEARAVQDYKDMITQSESSDIVYSNLFTGVHGNYLKPSVIKAGMDPDNLPVSDPSKMNFGSDREKPKAWKEIWGCGQGIGAVKAIEGAGDLASMFTTPVGIALQLAGLGPGGKLVSKIPGAARFPRAELRLARGSDPGAGGDRAERPGHQRLFTPARRCSLGLGGSGARHPEHDCDHEQEHTASHGHRSSSVQETRGRRHRGGHAHRHRHQPVRGVYRARAHVSARRRAGTDASARGSVCAAPLRRQRLRRQRSGSGPGRRRRRCAREGEGRDGGAQTAGAARQGARRVQ